VFDVFHHVINNSGETTRKALELSTKTWNEDDGLPMIDYSSQRKSGSKRKHAESLNLEHFRSFLEKTKPFDFDIMLELKDKEKSALKAATVASEDNRFLAPTAKFSR